MLTRPCYLLLGHEQLGTTYPIPMRVSAIPLVEVKEGKRRKLISTITKRALMPILAIEEQVAGPS
jgi:hypothetical protein